MCARGRDGPRAAALGAVTKSHSKTKTPRAARGQRAPAPAAPVPAGPARDVVSGVSPARSGGHCCAELGEHPDPGALLVYLRRCRTARLLREALGSATITTVRFAEVRGVEGGLVAVLSPLRRGWSLFRWAAAGATRRKPSGVEMAKTAPLALARRRRRGARSPPGGCSCGGTRRASLRPKLCQPAWPGA